MKRGFLITVLMNGLIAAGDIAIGFFFLFEGQIGALVSAYHYAFADSLSTVMVHLAAQNQAMGMLYFFSHGIVKLFLVWGLLTKRLWAYPSAIVFLSGFGIYQAVTLFLSFSWFTLLLFAVNGITVFFIAREYRSL